MTYGMVALGCFVNNMVSICSYCDEELNTETHDYYRSDGHPYGLYLLHCRKTGLTGHRFLKDKPSNILLKPLLESSDNLVVDKPKR